MQAILTLSYQNKRMTEKEQLEQKLESVRDLVISAERSVANAKRMLNDMLGKKSKKRDDDFDTS